MLGVVKVMIWPAAVELRNSTTPPLALVVLLVLTVAPVPTGERFSASKVCADKLPATTNESRQRNADTTADRIDDWGNDAIFIFGDLLFKKREEKARERL
jgi:hypothetical protein